MNSEKRGPTVSSPSLSKTIDGIPPAGSVSRSAASSVWYIAVEPLARSPSTYSVSFVADAGSSWEKRAVTGAFGRLSKDCSVTFSRSRRDTSPVRVEAEPSISECMMSFSDAMRSPSIEPEVSSTKVVVPGWR